VWPARQEAVAGAGRVMVAAAKEAEEEEKLVVEEAEVERLKY
jgi:hypothetical protein